MPRLVPSALALRVFQSPPRAARCPRSRCRPDTTHAPRGGRGWRAPGPRSDPRTAARRAGAWRRPACCRASAGSGTVTMKRECWSRALRACVPQRSASSRGRAPGEVVVVAPDGVEAELVQKRDAVWRGEPGRRIARADPVEFGEESLIEAPRDHGRMQIRLARRDAPRGSRNCAARAPTCAGWRRTSRRRATARRAAARRARARRRRAPATPRARQAAAISASGKISALSDEM